MSWRTPDAPLDQALSGSSNNIRLVLCNRGVQYAASVSYSTRKCSNRLISDFEKINFTSASLIRAFCLIKANTGYRAKKTSCPPQKHSGKSRLLRQRSKESVVTPTRLPYRINATNLHSAGIGKKQRGGNFYGGSLPAPLGPSKRDLSLGDVYPATNQKGHCVLFLYFIGTADVFHMKYRMVCCII